MDAQDSESSIVSQDIRNVQRETHPQVYNHKTSMSRMVNQIQIPTSQPMTPAKPIRRQAPKSDQLTPEELAKLGIKVRDFAYESTLPPIRSYIPRQIQPRLPPRQPTDSEVGPSSSQQKSGLHRVPYHTRHVRQPALANIGGPGLSSEISLGLFGSSQQSDYSTPSSSQPPLSYYEESQESEPYIRTPTITPNGSLQWDVEVASAGPASQLETRSQNPEPEILSYAELGFADPNEQSRSQIHRPPSRVPTEPIVPAQIQSQRKPSRVPTEVASNFSSPLSSPPGSLASITAPHTTDDPFIDATHKSSPVPIPPTIILTHPPASSTQPEPTTSSSRYHLRKRPAPTASTVSRPRSRPRRDHQETTPSPQPLPPSIQSAHAKTRSRGGAKSPRPLAVRRSTRPTPVR